MNKSIYYAGNNRSTGPSFLPLPVREVLSQAIISHRSPQFETEFSILRENLSLIFNSKLKPVIFTCSGTGGLEASLCNILRPDSKVLAITAGYYGDLYAELAENIVGKHQVERLIFPPADPIAPEDVHKVLKCSKFDIILLTHIESSTGVIHPLEEIASIIKKHSDALIFVDAIGSIGAAEFQFDKWGIDVAVTVPQKALMSPPGLAIIALSKRILDYLNRHTNKNHYFNLGLAYHAAEQAKTISTPCVTSVRALHVALQIILQEGIKQVYSRHACLARKFRRDIASTQYKLFSNELYSAPTITAIVPPKGLSALVLQRELLEKFNTYTSVGFSHWQDHVLRVGHMGAVNAHELELLKRHLIALEDY